MTRCGGYATAIATLLLPAFLALGGGAAAVQDEFAAEAVLVDADATSETRALFVNLRAMAEQGVLVGHHDSTAYGVRWKGESGRSDIRDVCGSYPAVYGWDLLQLGLEDTPDWAVEQLVEMGSLMLEAYERGGVNTVCWHMKNPVTGGPYDDTTPAVAEILPNGSRHDRYRHMLDRVAAFFKVLRTRDGRPIPIIFRPFHEHNGNWFWWGREQCTAEEYVALWRFTVHYLRDVKQVHQLLYAYSPDRFNSVEEYLERYPGDAYVDVLGHDNYWFVRDGTGREQTQWMMRTVVQLAATRGKLAALTETGQEKVTTRDWFTRILLEPMASDRTARRLAYVLLWRNDNPAHHYGPFPRHESAADFRRFHADPLTLFEDDLPDLYRLPGDPRAAARPGRSHWLQRALYANVDALLFQRRPAAWQVDGTAAARYPVYDGFRQWLAGFDPVAQNVRGLRATVKLAADSHRRSSVSPTEFSWLAPNTTPVLTVDALGIFGGDPLPAFLHAARYAKRLSAVTVHFQNPSPVEFSVNVWSVSYGGAALRFSLDGKVVREEALTVPKADLKTDHVVRRHNGAYGLLVPAGRHTVVIDNPGADWLRFGPWQVGQPRARLAVRGVIGDSRALAWLGNMSFVTDKGSVQPVEGASLSLHDMPVGVWLVEHWSPATGRMVDSETGRVGEAGTLTMPLPAIEQDYALRLLRQ